MRGNRLFSLVMFIGLTLLAAAASEQPQHEPGGKTLGEPNDEMALVYVARPGFGHAGDETWWFVDEQTIGVSKARGYTFALVPEGKRLFWMTHNPSTLRAPKASTPSVAESGLPVNILVLEMEFEKGETYYLEVTSEPGVSGVVALDEQQGKQAVEKCEYVALTSERRERGADIARDLIDDARWKARQQEKRARKKAEKEAKREAKQRKKEGG